MRDFSNHTRRLTDPSPDLPSQLCPEAERFEVASNPIDFPSFLNYHAALIVKNLSISIDVRSAT
jgi:hypothetical protein